MSNALVSGVSPLSQQGPKDLITGRHIGQDEFSAPLLKVKKETLEMLSRQIAAARLITDQEFLMDIALSRRACDLCEAAVSGISKQEYLKEINLRSHSNRVRAAAVLRINDQQLLCKLAIEDVEVRVVDAACSGIDDQKFLSDYLKNASNAPKEDFRKRTLLNHVTDQALLKELASCDITISGSNALTRILLGITDQEFVKGVIAEKMPLGRSALGGEALRNVTDQEFLKGIILDESVPFYYKTAAVSNVKDGSFLASVVREKLGASSLWAGADLKLKHNLSEEEKSECLFMANAIKHLDDIAFLNEVDSIFNVRVLLGRVAGMRALEIEAERARLKELSRTA